MALTAPENVNYAATIVRVDRIIPLENCDNVVGIPVLGYQAIVGKDTQVGDLLVVFPAETQLSEEFTRANNLFRHSEYNADPEAKGYLEDNRRVRAMRFRGHRSDALALPLSSLNVFTHDDYGTVDLTEGDTFDTINGSEVCRKYVIKVKGPSQPQNKQAKAFKRVDTKFLPEHYDTENYFRNADRIAPDEFITVTQKVHGTSIRLSNTIVKRELTWRERLARRFGVNVADTGFDYVFGSRKVIKDPNNPNQDHWYGEDIWSREGQKYADLIPQNVIVYGELIGWTGPGSPIQGNYTYDVPNGEARLYVYRVAVVTNDGHLFDLSWEAVKEFCRERGLNYVPELWSGRHSEFAAEDWLDWTFSEKYHQAVPLSKDSPCDEGVVVRVERIAPRAYKAKSPAFLAFETKQLDKEVVDIEAQG